MALFRAGNDEAFRVIHDRYRQRLFAYTRQMLPGSRQDAEDALQDVFVRAYSSLRSNDRELALKAWLYRVAHNRCIDQLRRPAPPAPEMLEFARPPSHDPIAEAEQRESLRRLIEDVRRLPDQQRSALLMRELSGMSYFELAGALGASVPAVKSLLVRARVSLAAAQEARDTACAEIRDELTVAHDRRIRPGAMARRHLRDCAGCREFRTEMRSVSRQLAALVPTLGPVAVIANALGIGGGAGGGAAAGGSAAAGGGAAAGASAAAGGGAAAGGSVALAGTGGSVAAAGTGAIAASGALATGASHVATLLAAAVITASGAVAIQDRSSHQNRHHGGHHIKPSASVDRSTTPASAPAAAASPAQISATAIAVSESAVAQAQAPAPPPPVQASPAPAPTTPAAGHPRTATPPHIPNSADSVKLPSSSAGAPADPAQTGNQTPGSSGASTATSRSTTGGTSTTVTTSATGTTTTSTAPSTPSPVNSTEQAAGSASHAAAGSSLPQTASSTSTSTGTVASADAGSASGSGSASASGTGTTGASSTPGASAP